MSRKRRNHLPVTGARAGIRVEGHAERCGFIWILGNKRVMFPICQPSRLKRCTSVSYCNQIFSSDDHLFHKLNNLWKLY